MTDQEFVEYRDNRFHSALGFYDRRARQNKFWYVAMSVFVVVASASVAVLTRVEEPPWRTMSTILATSVTIVAAILGLFQFQQNWLSYRATWDALQREPHLRIAGLGEYQSATDRNALFVERVESLLAKEGADWLARHSHKKDDKKAGTD